MLVRSEKPLWRAAAADGQALRMSNEFQRDYHATRDGHFATDPNSAGAQAGRDERAKYLAEQAALKRRYGALSRLSAPGLGALATNGGWFLGLLLLAEHPPAASPSTQKPAATGTDLKK
jgi:hypothetical protein